MNQKGITLIEVMVAMVIVSVVGISVLQSHGVTHNLVQRTQSRERLLVFAEGIMEEVIAFQGIPNKNPIQGRMEDPDKDITWTAKFTDLSRERKLPLVRIDLTVRSDDNSIVVSMERNWDARP